ncbi:MAG: beta-lactamase family protein [Asgard group archaeon]|nr:beta-lactamase family protein [Asgard group archaeon]
MNNTLKIFGSNKEEIIAKIDKIENSLVGVGYQVPNNNELGHNAEGLAYPNINEKKTIAERMKEFHVPGLCISVINDYEVEWVKSYGVKNINTQENITIDTIFQSASISKTFVATLALHLVGRKALDLNEPVNNRLKDWQIPDNEFTKEIDITLKHLLTHTSGINLPFSRFGREEGTIPTIIQTLKGESPAKNKPVNVISEPGSKHQYSNFGFIIIEKLIEDVTSKKLNEFAKEVLFDPLGLVNSHFVFPSKELQKQMISPHNADGIVYEPHVGLLPSVFGCGGLITTPHDITKIAIELMDAYQGKSNKILSTSIAKEMISKHYKLDPIHFYGCSGQGLGVFLFENGNDFFFGHRGGGEPGSSSVFYANPKTGHGMAVMANSNVGHQLFDSIKFTLAKEYNWSVWND